MINFEEFQKVELRVAKILEAGRIEGSEKLLKLIVDLGDPSTGSGQAPSMDSAHSTGSVQASSPQADSTSSSQASSGQGKRQIIAGIGKAYDPESLIGKEIAVVVNLEPRQLMGLESKGMILAAGSDNGPIILIPEKEVPPGSKIS